MTADARRRRATVLVVAGAVSLALVVRLSADASATAEAPTAHRAALAAPVWGADSSGCMACHEGIEEMHPEADLTCVRRSWSA